MIISDVKIAQIGRKIKKKFRKRFQFKVLKYLNLKKIFNNIASKSKASKDAGIIDTLHYKLGVSDLKYED